MKRFLTCLAAALHLALLGQAAADTERQRLPDLTGYFLDGEPVSLPSDLESPATLLVVTREDPGTGGFESWRDAASELSSDVDTVFVVLMANRRGIERAVAAGRLRRDVRDPKLRASIVPVFQEGREIQARLGLGAGVSALLVNQAGEILWQSNGAASEAATLEIRRILDSPPQERPRLVVQAADTAPAPAAPSQAAPAKPVAAPLVRTGTSESARAPALSEETEILPALVNAPSPQMPIIEGVTLSGRTVRLPEDLSAAGTHVILFPDYESHDALQSVLARMQETPDDDWLVLAFQRAAPRFGRAFAAGRLRAQIDDAASREHVVPVYMDTYAFEQLAGLSPEDGVRLIKVDNAGSVSIIAYPSQNR